MTRKDKEKEIPRILIRERLKEIEEEIQRQNKI